MRLESRQMWRVIDGPIPIEIRLDRTQTFDEDHVNAEIDVDGRRYRTASGSSGSTPTRGGSGAEPLGARRAVLESRPRNG